MVIGSIFLPLMLSIASSRSLVLVEGGMAAGRLSSDIPKRYNGARDTTFARSAREIIGFLSVTDTYIDTNYFRDATQN